jgi:UDP-N-acetylglucosamine:LPS N-acetylglucosamine transferase
MTVVGSITLICGVVLLGRTILSWKAREQIRDDAAVFPGGPQHRERYRILVLLAAIGGGHEAMAYALRCELARAGHEIVSIDGLHSMSPRFDRLLRSVYRFQLEHAPWSYELLFHLVDLAPIARLIRLLSGLLFGRRLQRIIERERPDIVVSTYPLVTATLGWLRLTGRLATPAVAVISDYGVHKLWVAPGIDRHLVLSAASARAVQRAGSNSTCVIRPPLAPAFAALPPDRAAARRALGIPEDAFVALVTGGAWGVGALAEAVELVVSTGAFAVVVTGRNTRLRARLERRFHGYPNALILGWVNDMPQLMAAADCLIQNAGGVTCLEAMAVGRPIIIYRPIPGHGRLNARFMEQVGVARWAHDADELHEMLRAMASGMLRLSAPCFESDVPASAAILSTEPLSAARSGRASPSRSLPRLLPIAASLVAAALWITLSPGALAMTGRTLRLPITDDTPAAGEEALVVIATDPLVAGALQSQIEARHVPATLLVDAAGARGLHPTAEISFGVVESSGQRHLVSPWRRRQAVRQAVSELEKGAGASPVYFLPSPGSRDRPNLTVLMVAPVHTRILVMTHGEPESRPASVIVLDTSSMTPDEAQSRLEQILSESQFRGLRWVPLDEVSS